MTASIVLHQYAHSHGIANVSPFCAKLETWLRMHDIPFTVELTDHPSHAPKKKAPWITMDGRDLADTTFIIDELSRLRGLAPDAHLTPAQRAVSQAVKGMVEEHLYFGVAWLHFVWDPGWAVVRDILHQVPAPMRPIATFFLRRSVRTQCWYQGMGRHSFDELCDLVIRDLDAIEELMVGPFFFGEEPCDLDATVFASLLGLARLPLDSPVHARVRESEKLTAYVARIEDRYYGHLRQLKAA